ncbi:hypothetical protein RI054_16g76500 [Pseudoscourfieldia marina]
MYVRSFAPVLFAVMSLCLSMGSSQSAHPQGTTCNHNDWTEGSWELAANMSNLHTSRCMGWSFKPSTGCTLPAINANNICRALECKNVLIVGDSLNRQLSDELAKQAGGVPPFHQSPDPKTVKRYRKQAKRHKNSSLRKLGQVHRIDYKICESECVAEGGILARYWRHDFLFGHYSGYRNLEQDTWVNDASNGRFHTIILNTGAHLESYRASKKVFRDTLSKVSQLALHLQKVGSNTTVLYRTTPPGHHNCAAFNTPLESQPVISKEYSWDKIPDLNTLARGMLPSYNIRIVDVEHLSSLRPDCHVSETDCLHLMPEVILAWISVIVKVLDFRSTMD